jgi:hypothetical protein
MLGIDQILQISQKPPLFWPILVGMLNTVLTANDTNTYLNLMRKINFINQIELNKVERDQLLDFKNRFKNQGN